MLQFLQRELWYSINWKYVHGFCHRVYERLARDDASAIFLQEKDEGQSPRIMGGHVEIGFIHRIFEVEGRHR